MTGGSSLPTLPPARLPAVRAELGLLREAVDRKFADPARRALVHTADSQGIGGRHLTGERTPRGEPW
ncbi:hypothetical protein [Streptomyces sp. NPDC051577]|uniref:hypothetical protein n=1 Tax=Streptomyces sp. NPDC051577 TaxID=3155166 RepID=UPI003441ECD1